MHISVEISFEKERLDKDSLHIVQLNDDEIIVFIPEI